MSLMSRVGRPLTKIRPRTVSSSRRPESQRNSPRLDPMTVGTPSEPGQPSDGGRNNIGGTITKFVLAAAAAGGLAYGVHYAKHATLEPSFFRQPIPISSSEGNLRQRFNFIDKVVKKCASSVVYIEIKDPTKTDPETGRPITSSNGSGFIVRDDGWILTNAHVVINKPTSMIMVKMQDGSAFEATVVDADMNIDLALLKVRAGRKLPSLRLGNSSDVSTGEWVVALGSPLSLSHSVTAGVISSVDRAAEELGLRNLSMRYIQTDAAITFGNSGGPLVNLEGEVIGINNLRVTAGIAFAIPVDYAKKFLERSRFSARPDVVSNESQKRASLGITTITVTPRLLNDMASLHQNIPNDFTHGVLVWKVANNTPAKEGGLLAGDIITHINGTPVHEVQDIYALHSSTNRLKLEVFRRGKKKEIVIRMG